MTKPPVKKGNTKASPKSSQKAFHEAFDEDFSDDNKVTYRKYPQTIHYDARYRALSPTRPSGRGLYSHLLIGSHTLPIPGLAHIGRAAMAEELCWDLADFDAVFAEVQEQGLVFADWEARVIFVPDVLTYERPQSPNVITGWKKFWARIPDCELKLQAYYALEESVLDREPFLKAFRLACLKPTAMASRIQRTGSREQGAENREQGFKNPIQERNHLGEGGSNNPPHVHTRGEGAGSACGEACDGGLPETYLDHDDEFSGFADDGLPDSFDVDGETGGYPILAGGLGR